MNKLAFGIAFMAILLVLIVVAPTNAQAYNSRPVAVLSASPTTICAGATVHFDGGSSFDPDGQVQQYLYEYGDGSDSAWIISLDYSYHTYHNTGTYYAKLRVKDNQMYISDYSNYVTIQVLSCGYDDHYPEIVDISIYPKEPDSEDNLNCRATFTDIDSDLSHTEFKWYRNGGVVWQNTKTLCDGCSSADDTLPFTAIDAGDTVKCEVTVYDYTGKSDRDEVTVSLGYRDSKPIAILESDETEVCVGDYVKFDGSRSYDSDGNVKQYYYEFGDETNSPWITDTTYTYHMYNREGIYYARLKVKDNLYQASEWSTHVRITVNDECDSDNHDPVLEWMGLSPSSPATADDITCRVEIKDVDNDIERVIFTWSIDNRIVTIDTKRAYDGEDSVSSTLPSKYTDNGDRVTCEAKVYDGRSNYDSESKTVDIDGYNDKYTPVAVLDSDKRDICVGERVYFDGSDSYTLDMSHVKYYSFESGDGSSTGWVTSPAYSVVYGNEGTYMARLLVRDSEGKISDYDTVLINVGEEDRCKSEICEVQMIDFDYLASGMTGNKLWARARMENTGDKREKVTFYLYIDDVLEDKYSTYIEPDSVEEKKFYFYVNNAGNKEVRISAYAECGASDERKGTVTVEKGFVPEPVPEPDELRVNVYPKNLDLVTCEGRTVTVEINSPDRREFTIEVNGLRDEWLEYDESIIVDGEKKAYVFVNPQEGGIYHLVITVRTGERIFTQAVYIYVAPSEETKVGSDLEGALSGMFLSGSGNWLIGLFIIILIVAIVLIYRSNKNIEKNRYEKRRLENRPSNQSYPQRKSPGRMPYYGPDQRQI